MPCSFDLQYILFLGFWQFFVLDYGNKTAPVAQKKKENVFESVNEVTELFQYSIA
jgi:hypothetical protein